MTKKAEQIKHAEERFKNFTATFKQYDGLATLVWKDVSGSSCYYVRYVFDGRHLYISGDLGAAAVELTERATLETLSNYINMVSYFIEKIECSTDKYDYDEELAKVGLEEQLLNPSEIGEFREDEIRDRQELIASLLPCLDNNGWHLEMLDADEMETLEEIDQDYWEWIYSTGRYVDTRVILWLVGLQMAWDQVKK